MTNESGVIDGTVDEFLQWEDDGGPPFEAALDQLIARGPLSPDEDHFASEDDDGDPVSVHQPAWLTRYVLLRFALVFWLRVADPENDWKGPSGAEAAGWPTKVYRACDYRDGMQVGVKTGTEVAPGRFLMDADLDWKDGIPYADRFLPATGFTFGRPSKPLSHQFYTTSSPVVSMKFEDVDGTCLVERRGTKADGSIGLQTMLPLSVHRDSGEHLTGEMGDIAHSDAAIDAITWYAVACLLGRHWPKNGKETNQHDTAAHAAGFLCQRGVDLTYVPIIIEVAATLGGDDHVSDRVRFATDTVKKYQAGTAKLTGGQKLGKEIGKDVVARLREWLPTTEAADQVLDEFQHFFITQLGSKNGGKLITMVGCDRVFPPSFQSYGAFRDYYCDTLINIGTDTPKWTTRAKLWLQNKQHRKYTDVLFIPPPLPVPDGVLNLWNGFAVTSDPDPHPERRCPLFLAHIRSVICGGEDPDVAEFHLDVLAAKIQNLAKLTEVALVYRGPQGIGKNAVVDYLEKIFGRHFAIVDKQQLVTGKFNAVLSSKLVLVLDEAMWPGFREFTGALKSLITNRVLMVERKGIDPIAEPNYAQTFVLTNGDWAWPAELSDRRALILDVLATYKDDIAYFKAFYDEMAHGGPEALLAFLQQLTHELRLVPHTKARAHQVALTDDDPVRSMWFDMLWRGTTWPEGEGWDAFICTKDFDEYYVERCRATRQKPLPQKLLLTRWHLMLPPSYKHPKQKRIIDRELILNARKRGGWQHDRDGLEILPDVVMRRGTVVPLLETCRTYYADRVETRVIEWPTPTSDAGLKDDVYHEADEDA